MYQCSYFVDSLLPPLNKSMCSRLVKFALPPLRPLAHGVLQRPVIGVVVSSQDIFQRTKQMISCWCEVRTVGWLQQHPPSKTCDGIALSRRRNISDTVLWEEPD
jgi:hypothetical protein